MAHSTITHDGLLINGEPIYLLSGVIHYFRWPKGEWRDILLKAKAGGLNTIDTVIPWNLHEPEPGVFNFAAEADLPAYLDLIHELGMYAIVRPGPYICAEWENGGFPVWLTARSATQNLKLRTDDPVFLAAVQRWFDRLLPIFVARQIDRGGPIILCQIENEHWASGVYGHDAHQATLAQMQHNAGLTVPFYTCMGGLDGYPEFRNGWSGMAAKLQATRSVWPDNPMIGIVEWLVRQLGRERAQRQERGLARSDAARIDRSGMQRRIALGLCGRHKFRLVWGTHGGRRHHPHDDVL
jgi:beta-galactosidase